MIGRARSADGEDSARGGEAPHLPVAVPVADELAVQAVAGLSPVAHLSGSPR